MYYKGIFILKYVSTIYTGAVLYYILCQCGRYNDFIVLQSVIAVCTGTFFTVISVSAVCAE